MTGVHRRFPHHYLLAQSALCPNCFSEHVDWIEASGTGKVYSYSTAYTMSG